jgi:hypothetical protein
LSLGIEQGLLAWAGALMQGREPLREKVLAEPFDGRPSNMQRLGNLRISPAVGGLE